MYAKKLTLAVSFMMVLAAAFLLVVPSESDGAADLEITDAHFKEGKSGYKVMITLSKSVSRGEMFLYHEDALLANELIDAGDNFVNVFVGTTLEDGTYDVVVTSEWGTAYEQIVWPAPVAHAITVSYNTGGTVTADKTTAYKDEIVNLDVNANSGYRLASLLLNGTDITGQTSFTMPGFDVSVYGVFEPEIVTYDVTFVVSADIQPVVKKAVANEILQDVPAAPAIFGAEFIGWFYQGADEPFDFATTPVTQAMTVYAHYGPEQPADAATAVFIGATQTGDAKLRVTIDADEGYVPAGKITGKIAFAYQKEILPGVMVWETGYSDIEEITVTNEGQYGLFVGYIDLVAEHIEYANNFQLSYEVDGKVIGQTAKIEYASA